MKKFTSKTIFASARNFLSSKLFWPLTASPTSWLKRLSRKAGEWWPRKLDEFFLNWRNKSNLVPFSYYNNKRIHHTLKMPPGFIYKDSAKKIFKNKTLLNLDAKLNW